tara:strand:- start:256 stop:774 length:519 start_codon:yes stop_codon:yes gene_type:complete
MTRLPRGPRSAAIGVAAVALIAAGAGMWFLSARDEAPVGPIDAGDARLVALGLEVYRQNCASCHGAKLEGQPDWRTRKADGKLPAPPHDETGHTWHHADDQLFRLTKNGVKPPLAPDGYRSDMPAFDGVLTDEEIRAALAYIKSSWPDRARARQQRIDDAVRRQSNLTGDGK